MTTKLEDLEKYFGEVKILKDDDFLRIRNVPELKISLHEKGKGTPIAIIGGMTAPFIDFTLIERRILNEMEEAVKQANDAFKGLASAGISASVVVDSLTGLADFYGDNNPAKRIFQEEDDTGVSYGKRQARFWANKPDHKIKKKL